LIKFLYEKTEEAFYIIFDGSIKLLSDYLAKFKYFRKKPFFPCMHVMHTKLKKLIISKLDSQMQRNVETIYFKV